MLTGVAAGAIGHYVARPGPLPKSFNLAIVADDRTVYGKSWDGVEGGFGLPAMLGGMALPGFAMISTVSPPDLAICFVDEEGADCQFGEEKGKPVSLFHDRYQADFSIETKSAGPKGILIYDIDGSLPGGLDTDDLVDMAILAPEGTDTSAIEAALRDMAEQISPTAHRWKPGTPEEKRFGISREEVRRRAGPIAIFSFEDCEKADCRLQQSSIRFAHTEG